MRMMQLLAMLVLVLVLVRFLDHGGVVGGGVHVAAAVRDRGPAFLL